LTFILTRASERLACAERERNLDKIVTCFRRLINAGAPHCRQSTMDVVALPANRVRKAFFWYQIGNSHLRGIHADDLDAARQAILTAFPNAYGQRIVITPCQRSAGSSVPAE
jgi:hypothetical protein